MERKRKLEKWEEKMGDPTCVAIDDEGRIIVGDKDNKRIQILLNSDNEKQNKITGQLGYSGSAFYKAFGCGKSDCTRAVDVQCRF